MLSFTGSLKVFIAVEPIDMRAGVNTLSALVTGRLKETAQSGALFVFTNKRRRLIKVLYWDGTGMWMMTKRLEQGTFFWPRAVGMNGRREGGGSLWRKIFSPWRIITLIAEECVVTLGVLTPA